MRISIFGLGYVGTVTAACFAHDGFSVIGVDPQHEKVDMIMNGKAPIVERGMGELIAYGIGSGRLRATASAEEAIAHSEITLICVGTPSSSDGSVDLSHIQRVCREIGHQLRRKQIPNTIVIRSTIPPGTTEQCIGIFAEFIPREKIHVVFNPEFLREGSAIRDFHEPPYTIAGTTDAKAEADLRILYNKVKAPFVVTGFRCAELIKYVNNTWHATKIIFANEIGRIAKAVGVDGRQVMDIVSKDVKLNISPTYLHPGFALGGSCLPKDIRALTNYSRMHNLEIPLIASLLPSNEQQIVTSLQRISALGKKKIGILGLAFKPGTDDLRESPSVELVERLIGKGFDVKILDSAVYTAKLIGSNRQYIETKIPHLSKLLVGTAQELLAHSEVLVITHTSPEFRDIIGTMPPEVPILDLAGLMTNPPKDRPYEGIAW